MVLGKFRRRGVAETTPADAILDRLLDREEIIDRFDASYIDDLPLLLEEIHGITDANVSPDVRELWSLTGRPDEELRIADLPSALLEAGVDPARHGPVQAPKSISRRFRYDRTRSFKPGLKTTAPGDDAAQAVNQMQMEYSIQQGGAQEVAFSDLARPETGDPWTPLMIDLRERGVLDADEPVLTIGPRWIGEIHYFRDVIGLRGTIGLDLFTHDDDLIKVGDMHDMPFDDNTFGLVYQRNTFDKSYDIRAALRECVRVLRDGGVLISDDCYAYTDGVSEMSRTSIKHNRQLVRALAPHAGEVLHDREAESVDDWIERVGQLAVRITKEG
jgi:SAM-dependent methyltransferase